MSFQITFSHLDGFDELNVLKVEHRGLLVHEAIENVVWTIQSGFASCVYIVFVLVLI